MMILNKIRIGRIWYYHEGWIISDGKGDFESVLNLGDDNN